MKAEKCSDYGFECPACSEVHSVEEKLEPQEAWPLFEHDDYEGDENKVSDGSQSWIINEPPQPVQLYTYNEEDEQCIGEAEPKYKPAYVCGKCETKFLSKKAANECCSE